MGIGILSLPLAMYLSGWILGIGMLVYVCLLTNYTYVITPVQGFVLTRV